MMAAQNIHSPIPNTKSQTCSVAFRELLSVRPDVPVYEALETVSTILASVRDQLTQLNADSEGSDAPEVWTSIYLLEICHGIVCAAGLGCRSQESPSADSEVCHGSN